MDKRAWYLMVAILGVGLSGAAWSQQKASNPIPADGAMDVLAPLLQWTPGTGATVHDVYLGTTPDLGPADLVGPRWPSTVYWYGLGIVAGTRYYWRVDEVQKDGVTVVTGDVWTFLAQPLTAFMPDPADGSNAAPIAPDLTWLKGQVALKHHVYFGESRAAVAAAAAETDRGVVVDPNYAPGELQPLTTYFWRVDELLPQDQVMAGEVWSFTTVLPVDDFESYTDEEGSRIYEFWVDGVTNGTGSYVGYENAAAGTFGETTIVHGGGQSMPLSYNNMDEPFYSETEYAFSGSQDWTADEVNALTVHIRGNAADFEIGHVVTPPVIDGEVDAVWATVAAYPITTKIDGADPTGPADASGQFRVLYDAQNLYALVDVNDEKLFNDSSSAYLDDSVEFYVDGDNTKKGPGLEGNNRQYTFGWTATDIQGTNTNITDVAFAQVNTPTGWRIELKFPWQSLMGTGAPVGKLIGIDCFYNDDDDGGDTRESQIAWHSTVGNDWQTPASWGTAVVASPAAAPGADRFYVAIRDASNHTATVVHPDPEITKAGTWVPWQIPLSDFVGVNLKTVRTMYIGVGDRDNPVPGGMATIFIDDVYLTKPAPDE